VGFFQNGSASNYTIGGARFWFNEDVDLTLTPPRRKGYRDMGNVVEHSFDQEKEVLDHYTARSGTRKKDRSIVRQIGESLLLTLDELSVENLKQFFRGDTVTDIAAGTGTGTVTDEVAQLNTDEVVPLAEGYNAGTIVVKDITGVTTYILNTDYTVVDVIGGYKGVKFKSGGTLVAGSFVRISYVFDERVAKQFSPQTKLTREGQALFFGVSDTGNEFIRSWNRVSVDPEGSFNINSEDWSSFQLRVEILDDTEATPTAPFGLFTHYGVGTDL
jgi:hypothetical protein